MGNTHNCKDHHTDFVPNRVFKIGISLNLIFVIIEIYFGVIHQSMALVSDALHNLSDVFGLLLAWLGYWLSYRHIQNKKYSFIASFLNSLILILGSGFLIYKALSRIHQSYEPVASTMIIVAFIGFVINFVSAKLFNHHHHHDLNIKAAYLHLMADAFVSLGVVVSGVIIYFTSWYWFDVVLSVIILSIVILGTLPLFIQSLAELRKVK